METRFTKGIEKVTVYYMSGFFATIIVHLIVGWGNKILMPPSFLVIILLCLIGLPWAFLNISNLLCPCKRPQNLGELFAHCLFLVLLSGLILRS